MSTWCVDFEFRTLVGESPDPLCMVARELGTGECLVLWDSELRALPRPFDPGPDALVVLFYAPADLACFLALGWPVPAHVIDLWTEYTNLTNGDLGPRRSSLVDACRSFGVSCWGASEKQAMRQRVLRGGPYSDVDRAEILRYCGADVDATVALWERMSPKIDMPRALLRGRYLRAAAHIEPEGVPIDVELHQRYADARERLRHDVVRGLAGATGVFFGTRFSTTAFEQFVQRHDVAWPRDALGRLRLDRRTFERMTAAHASIGGLLEARRFLKQTQKTKIQIGVDGRARAPLRPFASRTSRNQPPSSKFVFGMSEWMRGFIAPRRGHAIVELDFAQQEFGIAAALSGDTAMIAAYNDPRCPYLAFAEMAGAVPPSASKKSHPTERVLYKRCALAALYDATPPGLAEKLGIALVTARRVLDHHRRVFPQYWRWSDGVVKGAFLNCEIVSAFGWRMRVGSHTKERSVRNFPIQSAGAEILRLTCFALAERGIKIVATSHDSIVLLVRAADVKRHERLAKDVMRWASHVVLNEPRVTLRTESRIIMAPDRWQPESPVWRHVLMHLERRT